MGRRRINPRRVKIHRNYTIEEVARLFDAHKNTVRGWLRQGLRPIDGNRPTLIHGRDLAAFLDACRRQSRQACGPGRIYCVKCREPKEPAGGMADYITVSPTSGNLRGICPACHTLIHRRVSLAKLDQVRGSLEVTFPHADGRIGESTTPSLNCDSNEED
jgi:Helix-turn-helix domain